MAADTGVDEPGCLIVSRQQILHYERTLEALARNQDAARAFMARTRGRAGSPRGRDWARFHRKFGGRLVAFLHLHPRIVNGDAMTPAPSPQDAAVAWNIESVVANPIVYPIALFGATAATAADDMDVYGYERGRLAPIQWEVQP